MNGEPELALACAAAQALHGEWVEVFARRTQTAMTRLSTGRPAHDQRADGWLVGVRSVRDGRYGLASANMVDPATLMATLARARDIRGAAPRPWPRTGAAGPAGAAAAGPPTAAAPPAAGQAAARAAAGAGPGAACGPPGRHEPGQPELAPLRRLAGEASEAGLPAPVTITAGSTHRTVVRCDSAGGCASYTQSEAQLHIRCARPDLDAAQAARIRQTVAGLPAAEIAADYLRCLANLSADPVPAPAMDWVALSPLVTARMLSRLSRAFLRLPGQQRAGGPGGPQQLGSPSLTLVDDGTVGGGPAGAPFDDEGTPRRRTVVLHEGRIQELLGSHEAGPTTGNAHWAGWDNEITVAPTNFFLQPTGERAAGDLAHLPGTGFIAEDVRGFRRGFDLASSRVEFELGGAVQQGGERKGSGRLAVSVPSGQFLGRFAEVFPGTEFYRITGIYGGSWCLIDGSVALNDN
jgi:predicted Zn-dependent protease